MASCSLVHLAAEVAMFRKIAGIPALIMVAVQ